MVVYNTLQAIVAEPRFSKSLCRRKCSGMNCSKPYSGPGTHKSGTTKRAVSIASGSGVLRHKPRSTPQAALHRRTTHFAGKYRLPAKNNEPRTVQKRRNMNTAADGRRSDGASSQGYIQGFAPWNFDERILQVGIRVCACSLSRRRTVPRSDQNKLIHGPVFPRIGARSSFGARHAWISRYSIA